jgi:hypothetical protein
MHPAFFELFLLKTGQRALSLPSSTPGAQAPVLPVPSNAEAASPTEQAVHSAPVSQIESDADFPGIIPWGGIDD